MLLDSHDLLDGLLDIELNLIFEEGVWFQVSEWQKVFDVKAQDFRGVGTYEVRLIDAVVELFDKQVSFSWYFLNKLVQLIKELGAKDIDNVALVWYYIQWIPHLMGNGRID